ncbi:hypothetical protein ANTRET_LOCUS6462 [Anthophora retusa]
MSHRCRIKSMDLTALKTFLEVEQIIRHDVGFETTSQAMGIFVLKGQGGEKGRSGRRSAVSRVYHVGQYCSSSAASRILIMDAS